ncbi:hypothetical protein A3A84_00290 [Candidatus Collierbacteria bacterium RIFCSPLOWO2_01_FULL_50_23]|nr:MAG: hypothetical protein A3A84_00290 [Candidatus Collierbacteria bacterium RIFCSPLOWO2_01_FULL_50_23]
MESTKAGLSGIAIAFITVIVVVLLAVFGTWLYQEFEGDLLSRQFKNVKHSQAYVESTNAQMRMLVTEYAKAEAEYFKFSETSPVTAAAYQGQMSATLNQIHTLAGSLDPSEVAPDVQIFLAAHPNQ